MSICPPDCVWPGNCPCFDEPTTAEKKFRKHDMVKAANSYAREMLGLSVGLVVGISEKYPQCVRVLPAGKNNASVYHMDFWDVDMRLS